MSYDYNAILIDIQQQRKELYISDVISDKDPSNIEKLQRVVDLFADFSNKCPMTPWLWAQYAHDAGELMQNLLDDENMSDDCTQSNLETQRGILELAITEFPGCALLHRFHFDVLCRLKSKSELDKHVLEGQIREAYHDAWSAIGRGSHRNVDDLHVVAIHQLYVSFLATSVSHPDQRHELILESFLERAQTPMKTGNDSIMDDIRRCCSLHNIVFTDNDLAKIESVRRLEVKNFGILLALEENLEAAMSEEGLSPSAQLLQYLSDTDNCGFIDWAPLLRTSIDLDIQSYLMGAGMMKSSQAFRKYAKALIVQEERYGYATTTINRKSSKRSKTEETDEMVSLEVMKIISSLITPVYERAVSECPTVESLWVDYILYLFKKLEQESITLENVQRLVQVTTRSVRNCPYSVKLYGYRIRLIPFEAKAGLRIYNSENVLSIVDEAIKAKFITSQQELLELYLSAVQVFKESILNELSINTASKKYDEPEALDSYFKKAKKIDEESDVRLTFVLDPLLKYSDCWDDQLTEIIRDLIDDLRDVFQAALSSIKGYFPKWSLGKSILLFERATVEASIVTPILISLEEEEDLEDPILFYEQTVRVHLPPRPIYWRSYINFLWSETFYQVYSMKLSGAMSPAITVGARLRFIRSLFHRALLSTPKMTTSDAAVEDEDLRTLCRDFIQFEKAFGSYDSRQLASKLVASKMTKASLEVDTSFNQVPDSLTSSINYKEEENANYEGITDIDDTLQREQKRLKPTSENCNDPVIEHGSMESNRAGHRVQPIHRVRIGNLDYPAHPYTIKVSNLSLDTEDMDLVDFARKFGAIVHARILREKLPHGGHGKSRGAGLIQFEESVSVSRALEMNGQLGLKEKLVVIERSHQPAVSLVPPGMHRKNPSREGKYPKRNENRNECKKEVMKNSTRLERGDTNARELNSGDVTKETGKPYTTADDALSFVPRGVISARKRAVSLK